MQAINSRHFEPWLAQENISLAVSTYTAGKLMLIGRKSSGGVGLFERTFNRCMGLWADEQKLFAGTAFQIWRFENVLERGAGDGDYDRLLVPRTGHVTGDIDLHDLAWSGDRLWFVATLFSSLATLSERASFRPEWQPAFITKLAAEDRCHLNGLALVDGKPRFVTAVAACDSASAWREHRTDGGVVMDIDSNETVVGGLSMPHSPRWHDERLWLLDSGSGRLGFVDGERFEPVAFLPGYARGLAFSGDYAIVGVSRPRREPTFAGLPLEQELDRRNATAKCGVFVVRLSTGDVEHWFEFAEPIHELYDVAVLPGCRRPKALGFKTDEIRYTVNVEGNPAVWKGQPHANRD